MASRLRQSKRLYSVHDVVSIIEEQDFTDANIFMTPPKNGLDSDEDSGDDDGGTVNNLTGAQLRAEAMARIVRYGGEVEHLQNISSEEDESDESDSESNDDDLPQIRHRPRRQVQTAKPQRDWVKADMPEDASSQLPWQFQNQRFLREDITPIELFNLFFDEDVIDMIVEICLYASRDKSNHSFKTDKNEIKLFLAILLISGYSVLPRRSMYWEQNEDCHNEAVSSSMSRNRFDEIFKYLHVADNQDLPHNDKFGKVRPLLSMINERSLLYSPDLQHLSVDESMVPYYGRHSAKQFIRGKPVRFGFKYWVLATPSGYAVQFEPYQGANTGNTKGLGLGGSVVLDLLAELPQGLHYHVIFDNFFTSLKLLDSLSEKGIAGTGTIRSNRVERCPVTSGKEMKKRPRGSIDCALDRNSNNIVTIWNDNNAVMLASNAVGVNPIGQVGRWSRKEARRVDISQPKIVKYYNQYMGGVDRMDQNIAAYRIAMRSKKWWWASFAYVLDLAVQNAWLLFRISRNGVKQLDLLSFRREIVTSLLLSHRQPRSIGRPMSKCCPTPRSVPVNIRMDGKGHFQTDMPTQRRCAHCGKNTRKTCNKCMVGLHLHCFKAFHFLESLFVKTFGKPF